MNNERIDLFRMKKFIKFVLILLFLILAVSPVYAVDIDMNLNSNVDPNITTNEIITNTANLANSNSPVKVSTSRNNWRFCVNCFRYY